MKTRRLVLQVAGATLAAAFPRFAAAALDYPARPVRIIVGFPAGGPTDIFARLIAQWLSDRLHQPFVVDNRPGAGSTIGLEAAALASADGYTLALVSTAAAIASLYYPHLKYDFLTDIVPVAGIAIEQQVMVVHPSVPANTVPEFITYAKQNPGKIVMASVGNGTTVHLAGELFKLMAKVDLLHVPYRGAAPALTDLLAGRAQVMFEGMPTLVSFVREGKLRALAVTQSRRSPLFPDLPTVAEFLPGYDSSIWFGIGAPKKTPPEIIARLNTMINAGLDDPTIKQRIADLGSEALKGSPAEFGKLFVADTQKWASVMRTAGVKGE
ncbi:MAG TPA: tripartite tricarboxylate transporter substrate binding protein [Xanthobacteraceae bacterium]|nr:tripartite tricarboxylate transporter substrate binding protein [Xanthobacteraceae bacterium]